jgi:hypothetical protein
MSTSTFLSFYTTTVRGGQFPLTTYSTLAPVTDFDWFGTPTTTWTTTKTTYDLTQMDVRPNASLPIPSCVLPTSVPQCQSSWDRYIKHKTAREDLPFDADGPSGCNAFATTTIPISCKGPISTWASVRSSYFANEPQIPDCSQAKVPDDYCSSTRSQFIFKAEGKSKQSDGVPQIKWTETTIDGSETRAPYWPSDSTIGGPGCTLGCGSCAMQGGTVELIYWPPATMSANMSIHGPVTAEALGTTFTSPTVKHLALIPQTAGSTNDCSFRFIYRLTSYGLATAAADSVPRSQTPSWLSLTPKLCPRSMATGGPMDSNTPTRSTSQTYTSLQFRIRYTRCSHVAQLPEPEPKAVATARCRRTMLGVRAQRRMSPSL